MKRKLSMFNEFQAEFALSEELPYWDFLDSDDPRNQCVTLADGTLVHGVSLQGIDAEAMDEAQVNRFILQLRSVLNSLNDGLEVQFLVESNSDYRELLQNHSNRKGRRSIVSWLSEGRSEALRQEMNAQALRRLNISLFLYMRVHSTKGKLASFFERPKHFQQVREDEHQARLRELHLTLQSLVTNLESAGIKVRLLSLFEIQAAAYRVLNPLRSASFECPAVSLEHRSQEFQSSETEKLPELSLDSPRQQLACSDLIQGTDSFFLDGYFHRIVTLKTLPEFSYASMVSRFLSLGFPYLLAVQIRVPEQSRELSSLQARRRMAHSMSIAQEGRASDLESEAKLQSTEELLRELINTGQKIFYFQFAVLLKAKTMDELEHQTKSVLSRLREMNGAEGLAESVAGFKVFKTMLPGGNLASVRSKRVKTDNLADFLPLYQPWQGNIQPVCLFRNRMGGLVAYDPFDSDLPNFNALVTGSSGSGKSFLNNGVLLQYLAQDPVVFIVDIGGSYRKLCEAMNGQYIEISPNEKGKICGIDPFLLRQGEREPSPQKIKFLIALLESIFTDEDGDKLRKLDKSLLEEAVIRTYTTLLPDQMPTMSDFARILASTQGDHGQLFRDFAKMLYPWTGSRLYGKLLDTQASFNFESDFVVFDLKGLSSYPDLQAAMVLIITDFILGRVDAIPDRKKRIVMDEVWSMLKSSGASQFMEYCARTLRKSGSGITFITQGLEEIERSPIGPAILNNTATKFILMQRGDLDPIQRTLKLNSQEMALISSLKQQKGSYSEAFLMSNENRSVIRIVPTPLEYWLSTSDAADQSLLNQARELLPDLDLPLVLLHLATLFPRGSQGATDLPENFGEK